MCGGISKCKESYLQLSLSVLPQQWLTNVWTTLELTNTWSRMVSATDILIPRRDSEYNKCTFDTTSLEVYTVSWLVLLLLLKVVFRQIYRKIHSVVVNIAAFQLLRR